jgi:effector-binding domain-containing protein
MRAVILLILPAACTTPRILDRSPISGTQVQSAPLSSPTGLQVEANWKERLEQPYVYLEKRGDYRDIGEAMSRLLASVHALGLRSDGPPFALFYDDPGQVAMSELRARVCCPVGERPTRKGPLGYEILPRAMVVYARVSGVHASVTQAYPALFSYLQELGWKLGGPVREIYLATAETPDAESPDGLLTEVQIPWTARAE